MVLLWPIHGSSWHQLPSCSLPLCIRTPLPFMQRQLLSSQRRPLFMLPRFMAELLSGHAVESAWDTPHPVLEFTWVDKDYS